MRLQVPISEPPPLMSKTVKCRMSEISTWKHERDHLKLLKKKKKKKRHKRRQVWKNLSQDITKKKKKHQKICNYKLEWNIYNKQIYLKQYNKLYEEFKWSRQKLDADLKKQKTKPFGTESHQNSLNT